MTRSQRRLIRLVVEERNAIAVSFDSHNQAFLGDTPGFNRPWQRTALPRDDPLLFMVRQWLLIRRKEGPKGGRVFLTSDGAFTFPRNKPMTLIEWKWPRGDLVQECQALIDGPDPVE